MKWLHDNSAGAHAVNVRCYVCAKWLQLSQALCDLDGPAFEAYYCHACAGAVSGKAFPKVSVRVLFDGTREDLTVPGGMLSVA